MTCVNPQVLVLTAAIDFGPSGIELFTALKEAKSPYADKLVFITGGAFTPTARSFLESVSNDRLYKPIDIQELRRVVATRLNLH